MNRLTPLLALLAGCTVTTVNSGPTTPPTADEAECACVQRGDVKPPRLNRGVPESWRNPLNQPPPLPERVINGEITANDQPDGRARLGDYYSVTLEAGDRVRLWATGAPLDTMLAVRGPDDFWLGVDDFVPGTRDAVIEFEAQATGVHLIRVQAVAPRTTGTYQVGFQRLQPSGEALLDEPVTGAVAAEGAGPGVAVGAQYWLDLRSGERLRLRITSTEFDTTAMLIAPNGRVWIRDDAGDRGPNGTERIQDTTVEVMAPVAGRYHLIIAPYAGRGGGNFQIRTTRHEPVVVLEGEQVPAGGYAGRAGTGRIFGLFVGITDYQGRSRLYGCADDATLLAQAFRERALMNESQQRILTDLNANRAAFTAGLQWLAQETSPDDVVVIFYSGHGGVINRPSTDTRELDGFDENIGLIDGPMSDNDVVALIDGIGAGTIILALDSCHSGGFARDFLTRPGRIGLFSSDEGVNSDTAQPIRAGGYLSHALRRAVIGNADFNTTDGVLLAGELIDYLNEAFLEHNHFMNPAGSTSPRQWLLSDRGSLRWRDVLWYYPRGPDGEPIPIPSIRLESAAPGR